VTGVQTCALPISFGPSPRDGESSLRPIRDRFLAEIRFLKKYDSLDNYLRLYINDLKRRSRGGPEDARLASFEEALKPGKKLSSKKTILYLQQLEDMAERL
jgi:hypothetical protein